MAKIGGIYVLLDEETVMSWFQARASGQREYVETARQEFAQEKVLPVIRLDLEKLGFQGIKFRWNQKCGCGCGCSPGYDIQIQTHEKAPYFAEDIRYSRTGKGIESWSIDYWYEKGKVHRRIGSGIAADLGLVAGDTFFNAK